MESSDLILTRDQDMNTEIFIAPPIEDRKPNEQATIIIGLTDPTRQLSVNIVIITDHTTEQIQKVLDSLKSATHITIPVTPQIRKQVQSILTPKSTRYTNI